MQLIQQKPPTPRPIPGSGLIPIGIGTPVPFPVNPRPVPIGSVNVINIVNNTTIINNITNYNTTQINVGGWWWNDGYYHYYDGAYHYYGWSWNNQVFWAFWLNGFLWSYDAYNRPCYWSSDYWRCRDYASPEVIYVYIDETPYEYRSASGGGVVLTPDPVTTPDPNEKNFYSKDGWRLVRISGVNSDAYVYDLAETPSFQPYWLGSGVIDARFEYTKVNGEDLVKRVEVLYSDWSKMTFDISGPGQPTIIEDIPRPQLPTQRKDTLGQGPSPSSKAFELLSKVKDGGDIGW